VTPHRQRAAWAAVVVLGVLLPFAPAVLGLRSLSFRDTDRIYAPLRTLVVEALRDGRLPLWNPYEGTGKPLFAEGIHSVLHPLSLLGAAVAPSSIDFLILAYLVAAALGAFLLARTLEGSPIASAGAGLAFALSGYSVSMTGNLVFLAGLSTLPWLLAAARSAGKGSRWGVVLTAVATASAFFSGDVQITLVGLALGLLLAADAGGARGAGRALAGCAPGILLAAVQILATRELLPLTSRGLAIPDWETRIWSLAPARLLEWILPGLFRGRLSEAPALPATVWHQLVFSESVFLGAPLLVAVLFGVLRPPAGASRRTASILGASALVLLWLALGHHLGARQLLGWVPVWSRFRYAEKLMAPLSLCLSALAALGVDAFVQARFSRGSTRALAALGAAAAVALGVGLASPEGSARLASRLMGDSGPFYSATLVEALPHLAVALGALLLLDRLRQPRLRGSALALLVAVAPGVAVYSGAHLGSREPREIAPPPGLESGAPVPRVAQPEGGIFERREGRDYVDWSARSASLLLDPAVNVALRIDAILPYGAFSPLRLTALSESFGPSWPRLYRRFALTHVALPVPRDQANPEGTAQALAGATLAHRDEVAGMELWAVPHRPWAFFAERALPVARPEEARAYVLDRAILASDRAIAVEAPDAPPTAPGRVLTVRRAPERLFVEAESLAPALLVVQDAFWPGWRASIDGQPTGILAADYLVRAVRWPTGRHALELVYDPPELRTGLALSALGALLVLILAGLAVRR